tara:strand:+ start:1065 stop:1553 length:489 start_codon:yes stop_codon:yes gene_type:complete
MALLYRSEKGSALTITELDDNFRYFTGSHSVTGSLDINGGLIVTGSIIPGADDLYNLGSSEATWNKLFIGPETIVFVSGSGADQITSSLSLDSTGNVDISGSLTGSFTGSADVSGSLSGSFSGSIDGAEFYLYNLPTSQPAESGRLWLSGSAASSKFLMVRD